MGRVRARADERGAGLSRPSAGESLPSLPCHRRSGTTPDNTGRAEDKPAPRVRPSSPYSRSDVVICDREPVSRAQAGSCLGCVRRQPGVVRTPGRRPRFRSAVLPGDVVDSVDTPIAAAAAGSGGNCRPSRSVFLRRLRGVRRPRRCQAAAPRILHWLFALPRDERRSLIDTVVASEKLRRRLRFTGHRRASAPAGTASCDDSAGRRGAHRDRRRALFRLRWPALRALAVCAVLGWQPALVGVPRLSPIRVRASALTLRRRRVRGMWSASRGYGAR